MIATDQGHRSVNESLLWLSQDKVGCQLLADIGDSLLADLANNLYEADVYGCSRAARVALSRMGISGNIVVFLY
jgi:hypothetical protein